ncbi:MAG TPA: Gfo/Idh/MocA family oxidoreductase [Steroidobacteraceae bacterium]|nr:Gfo/Idh/MocA family oxidoreductase [Steroidobacteraceae bacterium]
MARRPARSRTKTSHDGSVRYAVLGLGHIAQAAVLPAFKHARRNSVLAALVSGEEKKLKQLGRRYSVKRLCGYEDVDELFASGEIDAVYIALPNDMHKEYTVRAARAGLHVLCEKPMAVTASECEEMIAATRDANVKLMIAYRLHFERANLEAAKLARTGKLGDLRFFNSEFSMQVRDDNIRLNPSDQGGGPLYDIGIYCINAARYCLSQDPVEVSATATRSSDRRFREVDETVAATMRFKDERLATFVCSFGAADRSVYSITGTKGSVTVDPAYEYAVGLSYTLRVGERQQKKKFGKSDQFAPELLYFSDCILEDRDPEPSGEEGLADVRIIEGMLQSITSSEPVRLEMRQRKQRPSMEQDIRSPPVPREPKLVDVKPASQ